MADDPILFPDSKTITAKKNLVICYYPSWFTYGGVRDFLTRHMEPDLCSHLIYAFAKVNKAGTVSLLDPGPDIRLGTLPIL